MQFTVQATCVVQCLPRLLLSRKERNLYLTTIRPQMSTFPATHYSNLMNAKKRMTYHATAPRCSPSTLVPRSTVYRTHTHEPWLTTQSLLKSLPACARPLALRTNTVNRQMARSAGLVVLPLERSVRTQWHPLDAVPSRCAARCSSGRSISSDTCALTLRRSHIPATTVEDAFRDPTTSRNIAARTTPAKTDLFCWERESSKRKMKTLWKTPERMIPILWIWASTWTATAQPHPMNCRILV